MNDAQIIETLATYMGWKREVQDGGVVGYRDDSRKFHVVSEGMETFGNFWNPLKSLDAIAVVEQVFIERGQQVVYARALLKAFNAEYGEAHGPDGPVLRLADCITATARDRTNAAVSVIQGATP